MGDVIDKARQMIQSRAVRQALRTEKARQLQDELSGMSEFDESPARPAPPVTVQTTVAEVISFSDDEPTINVKEIVTHTKEIISFSSTEEDEHEEDERMEVIHFSSTEEDEEELNEKTPVAVREAVHFADDEAIEFSDEQEEKEVIEFSSTEDEEEEEHGAAPLAVKVVEHDTRSYTSAAYSDHFDDEEASIATSRAPDATAAPSPAPTGILQHSISTPAPPAKVTAIELPMANVMPHAVASSSCQTGPPQIDQSVQVDYPSMRFIDRMWAKIDINDEQLPTHVSSRLKEIVQSITTSSATLQHELQSLKYRRYTTMRDINARIEATISRRYK